LFRSLQPIGLVRGLAGTAPRIIARLLSSARSILDADDVFFPLGDGRQSSGLGMRPDVSLLPFLGLLHDVLQLFRDVYCLGRVFLSLYAANLRHVLVTLLEPCKIIHPLPFPRYHDFEGSGGIGFPKAHVGVIATRHYPLCVICERDAEYPLHALGMVDLAAVA